MFTVDRLADPAFFEENRLPAHSDHVSFADAMEMAEGVSSLRRSLDGICRSTTRAISPLARRALSSRTTM